MSNLVVISVLWRHNNGTLKKPVENINSGKRGCLTQEIFSKTDKTSFLYGSILVLVKAEPIQTKLLYLYWYYLDF